MEPATVSQSWAKILRREPVTELQLFQLAQLLRSANTQCGFQPEAIDLGFGRGVMEGPGIQHAFWEHNGHRWQVHLDIRSTPKKFPKEAAQVIVAFSQVPDPWYLKEINHWNYRKFVTI